MSNDMDPSAAAEFATGEAEGAGDTSSPMDGHIDVEGIDMAGPAEPGPDTGESLVKALWNTEPNTPLEKVEHPWNPEKGGLRRVFRGIQKMGDVDGLPAIADVVIGLAEEYTKRTDVSSGGSDGSSSSSGGGGDESLDLEGNNIPTVGDA